MLKTHVLPWEKSALRGLLISLAFLVPLSLSSLSAQGGSGNTDGTGGETEGQLNCFEVLFPSAGVRAIVPNYPDMGPAFAARMRATAKRTFRRTALAEENPLAVSLQAGTLYGMEFDWFFALPSPSTTGLPSVGPVNVFGNGANGEPRLFAQVFGYDAAGYAVRKAMIEDMVGHPMVTYVLFAGDLVATEELSIAGRGNSLFGPLHANEGVEMTGVHNRVQGPLVTNGSPNVVEGNDLGLVIQSAPRPVPAPFDRVETLRARALATGTYLPGDLTIEASNLPPAGLVFAEGSIRVNVDGVAASWTLVSASGDVSFRGDRQRIRPFLAGQLAIAFEGNVSLRGEGAFLTGILAAPKGQLAVSGDGNTLLGALHGSSVSVTGSDNSLTDGSEVPQP